MSTSCSIKLKVDQLPKVFGKVEFFLYRVLEQQGIDPYKIIQQPKNKTSIDFIQRIKSGEITKEKLESLVGKKYAQVLIAASNQRINRIGTDAFRTAQMASLFDTIISSTIPSYINDYIEKSKILKDQGKIEGSDLYNTYAANLQNLLSMWDQISTNFLSSSDILSTKIKFKMDEDGLVDLDDVADDEKKMVSRMVFDRPSNEVDPIDDIDKSVEIFLKSLHAKEAEDDYGFTVSVNYPNLIKNLFNDLQNSVGLQELIEKLEQNKSKVPEYQQIIDKIKYKPKSTAEETQFRINFTNSFAKAFMPIMVTSIENEGGIVKFKVLEGTSNKVSAYEKILESNFTVRGMRVNDGKNIINLAHQDADGVWMLTREDIPKIKEFLDGSKLTTSELKRRKVEFLKGLGFDFSPKTEEYLTTSSYLNSRSFDLIANALVKALELNPYVINPVNTVRNKIKNLPEDEAELNEWLGQNNNIKKLITLELKNNTTYNIEKSVITAEGTRQHSIQLHNNFTILNKFFSGVDKYPTLQSIIDSEPSMFWLDPTKNPNIRGSYYLNSLFYLDPNSNLYGQRRKVKNKKYSTDADAEPVVLTILNTGGLQLKLLDEFEKEGASSTSLNELDKILSDIHAFYAKNYGYGGVLRLGDKSTDLGIGLNFGWNAATDSPIEYGKPLGSFDPSTNIFTSDSFKQNVKNAILDYVQMRYLGEKGFFKSQDGDSGLKMSGTNYKNWSYFEDILQADTKKDIEDLLENSDMSLDMIAEKIKTKQFNEKFDRDIIKYFTEKAERFYNKIHDIQSISFKLNSYNLTGRNNLKSAIFYYIANSFITDLDQMKLFFGDAMFFKDFHKRASKDSATGIFTMMDDDLISDLNDRSNPNGYGVNTNLSARRFIERIYQNRLSEVENSDKSESEKQELRKKYKDERDQALLKQQVSKTFKSAVLKDIKFDSKESEDIIKNMDYLISQGYISDAMKELYTDSIKSIIQEKYKGGNEADGQGKCTFDFYRIMSIATSSWSSEQENVYRKIIQYNHYDELAEEAIDDDKRAEYIKKRDAVGYDPTEAVYFPPKKFQYSGPQNYTREIDGEDFSTYVPIFDKFSLQPLIPTVLKQGNVKTADWYLNRKMEYNGVGYVKFESGSKVESPSEKDEYYSKYDPTDPSVREIAKFNPQSKFKSQQELFFNHFKEQVAIDADIHESSIFGSQIRKLILMNLDRPEFQIMKDSYQRYLGELAEIEKTSLYNEMGIKQVDGRLKVDDLGKIVEYFFNEIAKKNQNVNVKKALRYDESTGKFEIPLDAAVQAQVLEGIIISAINNRIVRYKTNGSMLIQMSVAGSEGVKFNKDASAKALETYGDSELKYYNIVEGKDGKPTTSKMDVKIALTGQWLNLLDLKHSDGRTIDTLERLNDALNNDAWRKEHEKSLTMIAYRIPTQGRNFLDVMQVKQFLPASVGDAIIMPKECVIKSGSDFDIDKMFVFYPNLSQYGEYMEGDYTDADLKDSDKYQKVKAIVQNRLYETMSDIILHPANYMELVTPSENFHISPLVNKIFERLGYKKADENRPTTDYKNSKILERELNYKKFLSLLKGKSDLGIAAVANTFNVLFQLANAEASSDFLRNNGIKTFFESNDIEKSNGNIISIDYSNKFDEDGVLKSEFFSEFINAFVDVAKDDYVFAVNVVTELSPIMFYMKYAGIGSGKILNFINQPALIQFTKNLAIYQNKFLKLNGVATGQYESPRRFAMRDVLRSLGYTGKSFKREAIEEYIFKERKKLGLKESFSKHFTEQALLDSILPIKDGKQDLSSLSGEQRLVQISMLLELENLREQSKSLSNAQKFLNFDTAPFNSVFDVYLRNKMYNRAVQPGRSILSAKSLENIKKNSIISPLDVSKDIAYILANLFPVRNDIVLNEFLLDKALYLKESNIKSLESQDDMLKFARTAKNDYINYVLQNYIGRSEEGMKFFRETFETDKDFNTYMAELVETNKLMDMWNGIKDMKELDENGKPTDQLLFERLSSDDEFPFVKNIVVSRGDNNRRITTFKIMESGSNVIDKNSSIYQFNELVNLEKPEYKPIADFFKNLALYSMFQSGMNTSDVSYTDITPVDIVNKLYGAAMEERNKEFDGLSKKQKEEKYEKFYRLFTSNNPGFFKRKSISNPIREKNSRGKWYSETVALNWQSKAEKEGLPTPAPIQQGVEVKADIPQNKVSGVESFGSTVYANEAVVKALGPSPTSIDMIIAGLRTRTTRSSKEMDKYSVKVGDIVKHFGKSEDGTTKEVLARVTAIHEYGTPGWKGTWEKEGWRPEDSYVIDRFNPGAAAIEFELITPVTQPTASIEKISEKSNVKVVSPEYGVVKADTNPTIEETKNVIKLIAPPEVIARQELEDKKSVSTTPVFDSLPGKSDTPTMTYAGIGSRETPKEVLEVMTKAARYLSTLGYTLRSGAAEGADTAFEQGATNKEIFKGFEKTGDREKAIAHEIHPNLERAMESSKSKKIKTRLSEGASKEEAEKSGERSAWAVQNLMARNTNQVFGANLDTPVDFVLFWAKEVPGSIRPEGGTGQAVEMARKKGIPTINMADADWREQLKKVIKDREKETTSPLLDRIGKWIDEELVWTIVTPHEQIAEMYEKEKESGETIEEYLNRLSCLGKLN